MVIIKINEQYLLIKNTEIYSKDDSFDIYVGFEGHPIEEIISVDQIIELWSVFNSKGFAQYFKTKIKSVAVDESSLSIVLEIIGRPPLGTMNDLETFKTFTEEVYGTVTLKEQTT